MATDNTQLSAPVGTGDTIRDLADGDGVKWPVSVVSYATALSPGANTLEVVTVATPLPVTVTGSVAVTGTFWQATQPVSAASLPLPTGAATESTLTAVAALLAGTLDVSAVQSGTWNVGVTGSVVVTNAGTFAVQAAQSGTWNITNISGTVSLPTGASTEATLSTLNGKVTACDTGAVTISAALPAGTNAIGKLAANSGVTIGAVEIAAAQTIGATQSGVWNVGVSSSVAVTQSGTWNITNISGTVSLPTGASTEATLSALNGKVTACDTGSVTISTALPAGTNAIGKLASNTGVVIGAVEQSGTWNINNVSGTVSLPTGAATAAKQPALGTAGTASADVITVQGIASMTPVQVSQATAASLNATVVGTGTFAVQAAQSGTWNITNISGTISLPTGAATESTLSTLNGKVTACDTGAVTISAALPAGTNAIGKLASNTGVTIGAVEIASSQTLSTVTTVGTVTTLSQFGGNAINLGTGNSGTGTLRVVLATDQPALTNAQPVATQAATSGGTSVSSFLSTAAVQATVVKASAGQVYAVQFFNINSTPVYVRFYNQTGSPGTGDTVVWRGIVPGNTAGAGFVFEFPNGLAFGTGIAFRCTGAVADNDNTSLAANTVMGNIIYK